MARRQTTLYWSLYAETSEPSHVIRVTSESAGRFSGFVKGRENKVSGGPSRLYGRFVAEDKAQEALARWAEIKGARAAAIATAKAEVVRLHAERDAARDAAIAELSFRGDTCRPSYLEAGWPTLRCRSSALKT